MDLADRLLSELRPGLAPDVLAQLGPVAEALAQAGRIACYGVGREGLMMKALAMRLYHLGCDAHVVGDMTTPPLAAGDILMVSAGPGEFSTVAALVGVAQGAGARVICVTAEPGGTVPQAADLVLHIPAQTMAADQGTATTSILPMGSLYEALMFLVFELLVLDLRDRLGITPEAMRANHTNLE
ncbi:SIS domain-containing protein [Roseicyclus mahoneyensis]|uniref:3-hexulose-6-phosphate isomerase n=1 Tax=Roseicyclus mahoneyensis TaxID=164332 RepID=A0A316GJ18_9RHOB|nr:SIS domain-containing protein [Roseicyclus mahoneyensis]PWK59972.1 3-hexulose-6-phosphate isomerase [Roseicyclus mahoneyensis]